MAKRSKFIRLHGTKVKGIVSLRHKRIFSITDTGDHRIVHVEGSSMGYEVYDTIDEIEAMCDGRKRAPNHSADAR